MIYKYQNTFINGYTKNLPKEIFMIGSVFKTNLWTCKNKDLNGELIIGSFYKIELLLKIL